MISNTRPVVSDVAGERCDNGHLVVSGGRCDVCSYQRWWCCLNHLMTRSRYSGK